MLFNFGYALKGCCNLKDCYALENFSLEVVRRALQESLSLKATLKASQGVRKSVRKKNLIVARLSSGRQHS